MCVFPFAAPFDANVLCDSFDSAYRSETFGKLDISVPKTLYTHLQIIVVVMENKRVLPRKATTVERIVISRLFMIKKRRSSQFAWGFIRGQHNDVFITAVFLVYKSEYNQFINNNISIFLFLASMRS